jgi:3-isopropylmalate/(R)-2-methylmalate dehydratase small subunit
MDKFTSHTGTALPLRRSNVDTDQIIPAVYLKRVTRTGFEDGLFGAWRNDPEFILNGFRVVISSRFADIFRGNSGKAGLLAAQVEQDVVEKLWATVEADPTTAVTVDLEAREVRAGDLVAPFDIDDYTRWRLLEGLDDIGITLSHHEDIETYESDRPSWKPATL